MLEERRRGMDSYDKRFRLRKSEEIPLRKGRMSYVIYAQSLFLRTGLLKH